MKVLLITNLSLGNSATLPERSLYRGLIDKGIDLTVITHQPTPESEELEAMGVKIVYLPIARKIDFPAVRKLRKLIEEEKFDILHLTFSRAITNGLLASHGTGIKIVAYLGSLSLHWHDPSAYLSFLNKRINKLICLSDGVMEHVLNQARRRMTGKTVRIYKGYDPAWIKDINPIKRESLNIPENALVICCVANVRRIKGIPYLIKSADFLSENLPLFFLLVGPGMDSGFIQKLINKTKYRSNFRTVKFTNEVFSYISLCDLYVQPSLTEGLGRSVIEAMCLRKPVIVTDKGGAKELVKEGLNGYVVPVKSAKAIAEKIIVCFENRNRLADMGEKSRERIIKDFSPKSMIDQTYDLYNELLKKQVSF